MQCPKCSGTMSTVIFSDIEVDRCQYCHGIWFDWQEDFRLKFVPGSEVIDDGDPEMGRLFNRQGNILCPRDGTPLINMVDQEQPHIWVESCPRCFGIFLDAGEFRDAKRHDWQDFFRDLRAGDRK